MNTGHRADEIVVASVRTEGEHYDAAQKVLDAAHEYWQWRQDHGLTGAVTWITDTDGRMVVFTRGEYSDAIYRAIRERDGTLSGWAPPHGTPNRDTEPSKPTSEVPKCPSCGYHPKSGVWYIPSAPDYPRTICPECLDEFAL